MLLAVASSASPCGARSTKAPASTSGVGAHTRTSYGFDPSARRTREKTSSGVARSNGMTPSSASTAIVCMPGTLPASLARIR